MRGFRRVRLLALAAALSSVASLLPAAFDTLLTTHPAADYSPAMTPDGASLVFVSERDGAPGLFLRGLGPAETRPPRPLHPHPARTNSPAISPDGRHLAFVSERTDALGDVFLGRFPDGRTNRITPAGMVATEPRFSSDGRTLYFRMGRVGAPLRWHEHDIRSGRTAELAGDPPALLPPPPYTARLLHRESGAALLYSDDTNGDGTRGPGDEVTAWIYDGERWRQATTPLPSAQDAVAAPGGSELLVSARWTGNLDIASIRNPPLLRADTFADYRQLAQEALGQPRPGLELASAAWRGALAMASTPDERAEAGREHLILLNRLGRQGQTVQEGVALLDDETIPAADRDRIRAHYLIARAERTRLDREERPGTTAPAIDDTEELRALRDRFLERREFRETGEIQLQLARLLYRDGNMTGALEETDPLVGERAARIPPDVLSRALLQRVDIYTALGLGQETEGTLLSIFGTGTADRAIQEQATERLLALLEERSTGQEELLTATRSLIARAADFPYLRASLLLREGELLRELGETTRAESVLSEAAALVRDAPAPGAEAVTALARLQANRGGFQAMLNTYMEVRERLRGAEEGEAITVFQDMQRDLVRAYLEKGRYELRAGDPLKAAATYRELLRIDGRLYQGWRGLYAAYSAEDWAIREARLDAREATREDATDPVAWYRYGLALSYEDPYSSRARRALDRASALDAASPYPYLTRGFIDEQRFRRAEERGTIRNELLEEAALNYEQALALGDPRADTQVRADALLNLANVALALNQNFRANGLYAQREADPAAFPDPRTEFLFYMNSGIAAFRASDPRRAERSFERAELHLRELADREMVQSSRADALRLELLGRRALALMDAGSLERAGNLFQDVYTRSPENSLARVRALRNQALLLERRARGEAPDGRVRLLTDGVRLVDRALEELRQPGLVGDPDMTTGGGLINLDFVFASDPITGGGRLAFDQRDEEQLLLSTRARLRQIIGDGPAAIPDLERRIALDPRITDLNRAYIHATRSVVLSQLGGRRAEVGEREAALDDVLDALALTRFNVSHNEFANANAATTLLAQAQELLLGWEEPPNRREHPGFWMIDRAGRGGLSWPWEFVDRAAERLLEMDDPAYPGENLPLVTGDSERARLLFIRATAAERRAVEALFRSAREPGREGLLAMDAFAVHTEAAGRFSRELNNLAMGAPDPEEPRRLAFLSLAGPIRLALLQGDEDGAAGRMRLAKQSASSMGFGAYHWWYSAVAAASSADPATRAVYAASAAEEFLAEPLSALELDWSGTAPLLDALEAAELDHAFAVGDPEDAWAATERWRAARLRLLNREPAGTAFTGEQQRWLQDFERERQGMLAAAQALRGTPGTASVRIDRARENLRARREAFLALADEATRRDLPAAGHVWPSPVPFGLPAMLLEPPFLGSPPPALMLSRAMAGRTFRAVYTTDESRFLEPGEPLPEGHRFFALGDPEPGTIAVVSGAVLVRNAERLSLGGRTEPVRVSAAVSPDARALRLAQIVEVPEPLVRETTSPGFWRLGAEGRTMAELLRAAPDMERLSLEPRAGADRTVVLRLASWLAAHGVVRAELGGQSWIGDPLDPAEASFLAEEQLDAAMDALFAAMDADETAESAIWLERAIVLREATGNTEGLADYYGRLAELKGELGRWGEAFAASRRRVEILQEAGTGRGSLAIALRTAANVASRARQWEEAERLYEESLAIFRQDGNPEAARAVREDMTVFLENAGRYPESLTLGRSLITEAQAAGNIEMELRQRLRRARILRVYQNRYLAAEEELRLAAGRAAGAGLPLQEMDARLNLVRTQYALARFDAAGELARETLAMAEAAGDTSRAGQAHLELANIEWLRSDYFTSFREQQAALVLAQEAEDGPLEVAIRNVSGLTSWAVNDLDRAFGELESALSLAERIGVRGEIATTSNNLGLLYRSREQWQEALDWFGRALRIDESEENRWGEAYSLRNIGITRTLSGDAAGAVAPLRRALQLSTEIGDETNAAKAALALGDALLETGDHGEAEESLHAALEAARRLPLPEVEWRALHGTARASLARDDRATALETLDEAIGVVDALRASIRIEEFQDGFLLDKQDLYNLAIELRLAQGDAAGALETSERSRGRNFIDLLGNRQLTLGQPGDTERLERERRLRARVEELERARGEEEEPSEELLTELEQARQEYSDHVILMRTDAPELSAFLQVEPVSVAELQQYVEPGSRLLVYHILPDRPVGWVLGPDSLDVFDVAAGTEELLETVQRTRARLQNFERVEEDLAFLSRALLEPALPHLVDVRRIGIVPHRQLHTLPFAPLPLPGGGHLIDLAALYYVPSASVLRYTLPRRGREGPPGNVLAIGNPDLGDPAYNLPFAEKEAERLIFEFPDVEIRTGREATDTWLVENLPNYGLVHIASHGEYLPDAPLFSAVYLAPSGESDGVLTAERIFSLQLRADLIALSACQTGLGRVSIGDDVVGLSRAFTYAGTRQLLTTLWRVDDISTAVLFKHFYRNYGDGDTAEALRQAQIQMKERPEYRHPAHWAALVLSGDWQ